jgi:uncharacterized membrane protein
MSLVRLVWPTISEEPSRDQVAPRNRRIPDRGRRLSAFLWQHGAMTGLPRLPAHTLSVARSINNRGQAVGNSELVETASIGHCRWIQCQSSRNAQSSGMVKGSYRGQVVGS